MIPILYQTITEGTVPTHYGIGALTDTVDCKVTEERNGAYELTLTYAADGIHAEDIEPNRFIMAKPNFTDDAQIFRIYKVGKTIGGVFTVSACHVSYDLSGKVITSGTASSCVAACALLDAQAGNFTINTDKSVSASFSVSEPSSVRSWFGGKQGSLLDVYGGEWKYDNYTASLKNARGADRGVTIRYGKNLTQLSQELDMSNLVTGIIPFYIDSANGQMTIGARVSTGLTLDVPRDVAMDFSQDVDPGNSTPIATQLVNLATRYKNNNNLVSVANNISLDFVQLEGLTERVDLCDTVHIFFEALGISATAKCIKTEWDVINERYSKTTFGDAKSNIADTIAETQKALEETPNRTFLAEAIEHATNLISGNIGGYVILHDSDGDTFPDEILIMNTADITTATKVWRWNKSGLGYSGTGYAGPYGTAITADGKIVADYIATGTLNASGITVSNLSASSINTGTLNADLIKAGTLQDVAGNSSINMSTGVAKLYQLIANSGLTLVDSNNKTRASFSMPNNNVTSLLFNDASNNNLVEIYGNSAGTAYAGLRAKNSNSNPFFTIYAQSYWSQKYATLTFNNDGYQKIFMSGGDGNITCVSVTQTSSRKVKENIKPIEDASKILELDAVSFDFKDKAQGTDKRGFIAEDVAEVLPNLVTPETETAPASLDYIGMIPYLQAVIKDQEKRIKALEDKLNNIGG